MPDNKTGELIIPLTGGLNLLDDATQAPPGSLRDCLNVEVTQDYGYSAGSQGWSRYDGTVMGTELQDIYYILGNVSGSPVYGELVTLTYPAFTVTAICVGVYSGAQSTALMLAYTNPSIKTYAPIVGVTPSSVVGTLSGFTMTLTIGAYASNVYQGFSDPDDLTQALRPSTLSSMLQSIAIAHQSIILPIPGNPLSPPDSSFLLNDAEYCTHDCIVFNFGAGRSISGLTPQEGNIIKSGATILGTILSITVTSGDWGATTAVGNVVVYDVPLGTTFPANGTSLSLYTANGVTNLGVFATYTSAGSLAIQPSNSRSLIYKTVDQSAGYTSAFGGWTRVSLSRELPYTQAYPAQPSGIGFGPATASTPFSIYEYSRQGLTSIINQLTPLNTNTPGCNTATAIGAWTNINNIKVNDGAFAVSPNFPANSKFIGLKAQGFNFVDSNGNALPPNTAIVGITVTVQAKASLANTIQDLNVNLIRPDGTYVPAASAGKANGFPVANASTLYSYGGANDLWGSSFTLADLQNANFGVFLRWQNLGATTVNNCSVDFVGVTISYLPPTRVVYIRNALAAAPADVPAMIVHYTTDNNSNFFSGNATGTLTVYTTTTEAAFTAAGKSRVIGAGEQIRDAPGGAGNLLGWTSGTDYPISYPAGAMMDAAGAKWEWIAYNFYSDPTAQMAFGANGVEYGSAFDGTYVVRIRTGRRVDLDNPRHLFGYYGTLHLGYNSGDVVTSAAGPRPVTVSAALLSQAYNVGQPVVGFSNLQGQTLAVFCPRKVAGLQGTDPTNYTQTTLSPALGAFEYTVADVEGQVVWTSFRGVETMQTTNAYGNFDTVPLSANAAPWLQPRLQGDGRIGLQNMRPVYAFGCRAKRQYRVFFADGYSFTLTKFGPEGIPMSTIGANYLFNSQSNIPSPGTPPPTGVARHLFQGVRSDGKEVLSCCWEVISNNFGTSNFQVMPYVIRLDTGYMQDAATDFPCYIELNPVYPSTQNDAVSLIQSLQYQNVFLFASCLTGMSNILTATAITTLDVYTIAGTDIRAAFGNYATFPTTATPAVLNVEPQLNDLYKPLPIVMAGCTIAAQGRMIRMLIDARQNTLLGPMSVTFVKALVVYEYQKEANT